MVDLFTAIHVNRYLDLINGNTLGWRIVWTIVHAGLYDKDIVCIYLNKNYQKGEFPLHNIVRIYAKGTVFYIPAKTCILTLRWFLTQVLLSQTI